MGRKQNKPIMKPTNEIDNAMQQNMTTKELYLNLFKQIAITEFTYKGLPDTVDERFMELCLFHYGRAVFFKDEVMDKFLCLNCAWGSNFDVYGYPQTVNAFSNYNGYNHTVEHEKTGIIMFNDYTRTSPYLVADMYAERIAEVQRTIDVNTKAQKTPVLIKCDEDERLTLKNIYEQYDGNSPVIAISKNLNLNNGFSVLSTAAPFVADKLIELKKHLYAECLQMLGVAIQEEKKERIITAEIDLQQQNSDIFGASRYLARKQAVDKINALFGLNIKVVRRYSENYVDISQNSEYNTDKGNIYYELGKEQE